MGKKWNSARIREVSFTISQVWKNLVSKYVFWFWFQDSLYFYTAMAQLPCSDLEKQRSFIDLCKKKWMKKNVCHFSVWIITNWKILKEMGIPDHLTFLLRNLYAGQKAVTWNMEQNCERSTSRLYVVTLLFIMYAEYIMQKAGLDES